MKQQDYNNLCHAVESGEARFVENTKWRYTGKVIACQGEEVKVDAFGHHFHWSAELCRETRGDVGRLGPPSNK